ncbi:MAG TPA: DNA polymerase III subunit delta' [Steroidobacteraceae bacterium]|nr:DNA polymerase III subunit delta' [Steroidobacteraceae bacterium]
MTDPASLPWLAAPLRDLRSAFDRGRLGHAVLVHGSPGVGGQDLARWLAHLVLCEGAPPRPCGRCASCTLLAAGNHPDFRWIEREEDAKQLKVEQVRDLAAALALKSYRGGYKAAVIAEADAMNANAANALLKTLEEPPPATLLVLVSSRPSRLPATILSRCQRISVARPRTDDALAWLQARKAGTSWGSVLEHAAGEPLRALELEAGGFAELDREMAGSIEQLRARRLDIAATAERWSKNVLERRLTWLDVWLTRTIRDAFARAPALPSPPAGRNIRSLYALLDRVRALRLELDTSLNMQLATEVLLLRAESALAA